MPISKSNNFIRLHECDECKKHNTMIIVRGYKGYGNLYHEGIPSCEGISFCPYCGSSLGWTTRGEDK